MMPPNYNFTMFLLSARRMVDNPYIEAFLIAVVIDLFTGFAKSFSKDATHKADSSIGIFGAVKHLVIVVLILSIYPLIDALGFGSFGTIIVLFYIFQYALSILENLGIMGIPVPTFIKDKLQKLSRESDSGINTFAEAKNVVVEAKKATEKKESDKDA